MKYDQGSLFGVTDLYKGLPVTNTMPPSLCLKWQKKRWNKQIVLWNSPLFLLPWTQENVGRKCGSKGLIKDQYLPHQFNPLMYSLCLTAYCFLFFFCFFTRANHLKLIVSLCPFHIMAHTADAVSEHTQEAVSLITTLNPNSTQRLLLKHTRTHIHTHTYTHTHTLALALPTVAPPSSSHLASNTATFCISSSQPIPNMLLFRIFTNHTFTHKLLIQIHSHLHLDVLNSLLTPTTFNVHKSFTPLIVVSVRWQLTLHWTINLAQQTPHWSPKIALWKDRRPWGQKYNHVEWEHVSVCVCVTAWQAVLKCHNMANFNHSGRSVLERVG